MKWQEDSINKVAEEGRSHPTHTAKSRLVWSMGAVKPKCRVHDREQSLRW